MREARVMGMESSGGEGGAFAVTVRAGILTGVGGRGLGRGDRRGRRQVPLPSLLLGFGSGVPVAVDFALLSRAAGALATGNGG